jgi:hypothetical protein
MLLLDKFSFIKMLIADLMNKTYILTDWLEFVICLHLEVICLANLEIQS